MNLIESIINNNRESVINYGLFFLKKRFSDKNLQKIIVTQNTDGTLNFEEIIKQDGKSNTATGDSNE
jgi:hypothetical protein